MSFQHQESDAATKTDINKEIIPHLIGVLDLRGGKAVRAVAGERAAYKMIDQTGCQNGSPVELVTSYSQGKGGISTNAGLYIADLDAITSSSEDSWPAICEAHTTFARIPPGGATAGIRRRLWLDRGMLKSEQVTSIAALIESRENGSAGTVDWPELRIVIGTESIKSISDLKRVHRMLAEIGVELAVSIDLKLGKLVTTCPDFYHLKPLDVVAEMVEIGVAKYIVLDLRSVGTAQGPPTTRLCRAMVSQFGDRVPGFEVISGGGIRHADDVLCLLGAGCSQILVATWLQNSWDPTADIRGQTPSHPYG